MYVIRINEKFMPLIGCTVEPPNKGHVGTKSFVLYREVSFIQRL